MSQETRTRVSQGSGLQSRLLALGQVVVLAGVLLAVGLFSAYLGMRLAVRGTEVQVPAVIGDSLEEATAKLKKLQLGREVVGERFDIEFAENSVISQSPGPATPIKTGQQVQLILSRGQKTNPVPDLTGSSVRVARLLANEAGFQLGNMSHVSVMGVDRDRVIQQFPPPGAVELLTPRIDVLISNGYSPRYVMPNLVGQQVNGVLRFLENNSFQVGRVQYRQRGVVPAGQIIKQFPEPGFMLTREEPINLEVAR